MVMRGDVGGALASYEEIILEAPDDAQPRLRAAELYAKTGLRERAEKYRRAVNKLIADRYLLPEDGAKLIDAVAGTSTQ